MSYFIRSREKTKSQAAKFAVLFLLQGYKRAISPMLPPACRFVPTCSEYAAEAVERYGALRGAGMALARLLRCHPLGRAGYDPVVKPPLFDGDSDQGREFSMQHCGAVAPGRN